MDNVLIVVEDLEAAIDFFSEIGLELEGQAPLEGPFVDRLLGLDGARSHIATMRTPDGHGRIELDRFERPEPVRFEPVDVPANAVGIRRIMFAVDDLADVVDRLAKGGHKLLGEVVQYEDAYQLAYVRGPEGLMVGLAQPLK